MDNTMFDFQGRYDQMIEKNPGVQYPQSQYGFFENLKPLPSAIHAFNALLHSKHLDKGVWFDPYILTAPSTMNPLSYTEKRNSIEKHLGSAALDRLIISPVKHLNKGDYLIDDMSRGKGQNFFEGELILFGSDKYPDWASVLTYLKGKL
jgi:5'(3')-deoxyribonucleotidase